MDEITRLRKAKGWSQERLAREAGISVRTIIRVEQGVSSPTIPILRKIAEALGVTPGDLLEAASA